MEVPGEDVVLRAVSAQTGIPYTDLKSAQTGRGVLCLSDREMLQGVVPPNVRVVDESRLRVEDVASIAQVEMNREPFGLLVLDYLTMLQTVTSERRETEVGRLSREVKLCARELNIPVICCAQLNRESARAVDKSPMLHHLRDSGAIEQDADAVVMIWQEYLDTHKAADKGKALLRVAKNSHGPTGDVWATYAPHKMQFEEVNSDFAREF